MRPGSRLVSENKQKFTIHIFPNTAAILISIVLDIMGCPGEKCIHVGVKIS